MNFRGHKQSGYNRGIIAGKPVRSREVDKKSSSLGEFGMSMIFLGVCWMYESDIYDKGLS